MQVHAVPDRNNHRRRENVVASCRIARVNTKRIAFVGLGTLLCLGSTKHAVGSWIAEIPLELRSSNLDFNLSSLLLRRHHAGPQALSGDVEPEKDDRDSKSPGNFQAPAP